MGTTLSSVAASSWQALMELDAQMKHWRKLPPPPCRSVNRTSKRSSQSLAGGGVKALGGVTMKVRVEVGTFLGFAAAIFSDGFRKRQASNPS